MRQAYVAGSYSADSHEGVMQNIRLAIDGARIVAAKGFAPIIPHCMGSHRGTSWEEAMEKCRALIRGLHPEKDLLVLLPGWEKSRGATEERLLAAFCGIEIVELDSL